MCPHYPACNSYVGVHKGTKRPKGTLANGDLRHKRIQAHKLFDLLWQRNIMSRRSAYKWMSEKFGISYENAHIGCCSDYMCDQIIAACKAALENNHIPYAS